MAEEEPPPYRPRRDFNEPETESDPETELESEPDDDEATGEAAFPHGLTSLADSIAARPDTADDPDDDVKPLFRDEVESGAPGTAEPSARSAEDTASQSFASLFDGETPDFDSMESDPGATRALPPPRAARQDSKNTAGPKPSPPSRNHERSVERTDETTLLPRTPAGARELPLGAAVDWAEDEEDLTLTRRPFKLALAAVIAVTLIGLAIGYAVWSNQTRAATLPVPNASSAAAPGNASPEPSSAPTADSGALLSDESMLSESEAKAIDGAQNWTVALTQRGLDADSQQAACFGGEPAEGQPTPQQTILRLLGSGDAAGPGILHQASAYSTVEEATQAFTVSSSVIGGCPMPDAYLISGRAVSGLGDQATGAVVSVKDGKTPTMHTVVLNRTGRIVNIFDVARSATEIDPKNVTAAAAKVTDSQCGAAGGACSEDATAVPAPPPTGGDQPGFLTSGDIPPVGPGLTWVGTEPSAPRADFLGSQCEDVEWATVSAKERLYRTYILDNSPSKIGLDEIVLTMKDAKAAAALVKDVKKSIEACPKRKLTATVTDLATISGQGADDQEITGFVAAVSQKSTRGTERYRIGIASVGSKVVYTFLNPQDDDGLDMTEEQWSGVTVRAAERVTQPTSGPA